MDILRKTLEQEEYMVATQRHLHRHPETGGAETETLAFIRGQLTEAGIPYEEVPEGGIIAFIEGNAPGSTVLLRADIDALPTEEEPYNPVREKFCVSENEGAAHLCGHDAHTAMALAAARILHQAKDSFSGRVMVMFERGEENGYGMVPLEIYLAMQELVPDVIWGMHVSPYVDSGCVNVEGGNRMASGGGFLSRLVGTGGHGSRPDLCRSPVDCFAAVHAALTQFCFTRSSPFDPLTFSVCMLDIGKHGTYNVIPTELTFGGTFRYFSRGAYDAFTGFYQETMDRLCPLYGCRHEALFPFRYSEALVNDEDCAVRAAEWIGGALGPRALTRVQPMMASEPFSHYRKLAPVVYGFVGIRNPKMGYGMTDLHHPGFEVDPAALKNGCAAAVAFALGFLADPVNTEGKKFHGPIERLLAGPDGAVPPRARAILDTYE